MLRKKENPMAIPTRLRNQTWRVKEANTRVRENHERQRAIVHAQNRKQLNPTGCLGSIF